jgi:hypothetical protein
MCVYELFVQVKSPEAEYMLQGLPEFRHFSTCNKCKIKDRLTVEFYYSSIYFYSCEKSILFNIQTQLITFPS